MTDTELIALFLPIISATISAPLCLPAPEELPCPAWCDPQSDTLPVIPALPVAWGAAPPLPAPPEEITLPVITH